MCTNEGLRGKCFNFEIVFLRKLNAVFSFHKSQSLKSHSHHTHHHPYKCSQSFHVTFKTNLMKCFITVWPTSLLFGFRWLGPVFSVLFLSVSYEILKSWLSSFGLWICKIYEEYHTIPYVLLFTVLSADALLCVFCFVLFSSFFYGIVNFPFDSLCSTVRLTSL